MGITVKPVIMHHRTWKKILDMLHTEYPPSYFLRHKMRDKLGFTSREHQAWIANTNYQQDYAAYERERNSPNELGMLLNLPPERGYTRSEIHLDFYSENKRTMFLLKYSEELAKDDKRY